MTLRPLIRPSLTRRPPSPAQREKGSLTLDSDDPDERPRRPPPASPPSPYSSALATSNAETHTLSVLVDNEPGVLARVVGLFSGRGYNIESLTVAEVAHAEHLSRITIVTSGTPEAIEQIRHQLERLVPVHKVTDLTIEQPFIQRELAMVKVRGKGENRDGGAAAVRRLPGAGDRRHDGELRVRTDRRARPRSTSSSS